MNLTATDARLPGVLPRLRYCFAPLLLLATAVQAEEPLLEEVLVTAEFRAVQAQDLAASITVLDERAIADREAVHIDQLLNLAPNVNFAAGASRGRFIQIRGTGERSQFVEPVNPSVGLVIDGMDFTGIGGAATTMDIRQIEVLRGPQGTLFGANALAGLINIVSNGPGDFSFAGDNSARWGGQAQAILGNENTVNLEAALGGALGPNGGFRIAAQSNQSDGFIDNVFLGRPTNTIDETSARGRLDWAFSDSFDLELVWLVTDIDNGYDAFSLDNSRVSYADEPGTDALDSTGLSARSSWTLSQTEKVERRLELLLSHVDADTVYSYDEDWSNTGICDGTLCDSQLWGFDWWYQSTDRYERNNRNTTADLRLLNDSFETGKNWTAGVYWRDQEQTLARDYTFADGRFGSQYDTRNLALYGQWSMPLSDRWTGILGGRWENREWDFIDTQNQAASAQDDESFWGGRAVLEYRDENERLWYGLVSRGYKAGGYNTALASQLADLAAQGIELSPEQLIFDGETLWNYELGLKGSSNNGLLDFAVSVFYQNRSDLQLKQSIVIPSDPATGACPCEFIDGLQNAAGGSNSGAELELNWLANEQLVVFGTLGVLFTQYDDFLSFTHADADLETGTPYDLSGRDQAHAPEYQFTLGFDLDLGAGWSLRTDVEGKDGFYTSANHNERTDSYTLLNMRLNWDLGSWQLGLWGRNLTDESVQTRGFGGFGNDPRKFYAVEPYYQLGEPRVYGVSARVEF